MCQTEDIWHIMVQIGRYILSWAVLSGLSISPNQVASIYHLLTFKNGQTVVSRLRVGLLSFYGCAAARDTHIRQRDGIGVDQQRGGVECGK